MTCGEQALQYLRHPAVPVGEVLHRVRGSLVIVLKKQVVAARAGRRQLGAQGVGVAGEFPRGLVDSSA